MAIVWKDGERLYLTNWEYNMARVISEMARLIQDRGGRCKRLPYAMVTNRTNYNKAIELKSNLELYERNIKLFQDPEKRGKLERAMEKTRVEKHVPPIYNGRPVFNLTCYLITAELFHGSDV